MKQILKVVAIVIIIAITAYVIKIFLSGLMIGGFFNPPIKQEKMEKIFNEDYNLLVHVAKFLENSGYQHIYIPNTMESGAMSVSGNHVEIEDDIAINAIDALKKRGYDVITRENNTVSFQRWSHLDAGHGIAFSIDGSEPTLQFLTKLEKLDEANWYYYEEDFNKWKKTQPSQISAQ